MAENKVDIKVNDITTVCNKIVTDTCSQDWIVEARNKNNKSK